MPLLIAYHVQINSNESRDIYLVSMASLLLLLLLLLYSENLVSMVL